MKIFHARCGLSKKAAKNLKIHHCYLMAAVNKDGTLRSVQTYSEKNPTFIVADILITIMGTKGTSYQKANAAMMHHLNTNKRYKWALNWVSNDLETHMKKPELWKAARNGEIHVKHCNLESKFLEALHST